jgi:hypothetical protein
MKVRREERGGCGRLLGEASSMRDISTMKRSIRRERTGMRGGERRMEIRGAAGVMIIKCEARCLGRFRHPEHFLSTRAS